MFSTTFLTNRNPAASPTLGIVEEDFEFDYGRLPQVTESQRSISTPSSSIMKTQRNSLTDSSITDSSITDSAFEQRVQRDFRSSRFVSSTVSTPKPQRRYFVFDNLI